MNIITIFTIALGLAVPAGHSVQPTTDTIFATTSSVSQAYRTSDAGIFVYGAAGSMKTQYNSYDY